MRKKGQAAMEFLMTYGWAILAAIIVIGVLAIYFRPSQLTSNSVAVTPPFYGSGVTFGVDTINLEVTNNGGETVNLVSVNASLTTPSAIDCSTGGLTNWPTGNSTIFTMTCTGLASGSTVSGDLTLYYTRTGTSLVQQSSGSISGRVP